MSRLILVANDGMKKNELVAMLIRAKGKRLLIQFDDHASPSLRQEWFKKKRKALGGTYVHAETNTWFYRKEHSKPL